MTNLQTVLINGIFVVIGSLSGYLISYYFHTRDLKRVYMEKQFHQFYYKILKTLNYPHLIDADIPFNSLLDGEWGEISTILHEYDYLATREIQNQIYTLNRALIQVPEAVDETWQALLLLVVSEYVSLCKKLGYQSFLPQ